MVWEASWAWALEAVFLSFKLWVLPSLKFSFKKMKISGWLPRMLLWIRTRMAAGDSLQCQKDIVSFDDGPWDIPCYVFYIQLSWELCLGRHIFGKACFRQPRQINGDIKKQDFSPESWRKKPVFNPKRRSIHDISLKAGPNSVPPLPPSLTPLALSYPLAITRALPFPPICWRSFKRVCMHVRACACVCKF